MKRTYYRVEVFALGNLGGGRWDNDVLISGKTPEEAYNNALDFLRKQGFAFESKITVCDKNGEDFE